MLFQNAELFTPQGRFVRGGFRVDAGRFTDVFAGTAPGGGVDLAGAKVIPGLIDLHTHGNSGADFSDGDWEGLLTMAAFLARRGVTSFAPASMTLPYETLRAAFANAARLRREAPRGCARLLGVQMEGPFFSEKRKGAQNGAYLRAPDPAAFRELYEGSGGVIKIADLAPELPGAEAFVREVSGLCTVSVAHTDADYESARRAFAAGARHLTHLFNAMPPLLHRDPGVIGAAAEREDVTAELICDGLHVHPSAVRAAFRLFPGRICLISDALRCCGMPEGAYTLGGQEVFLKGGIARLADGTIAGSASTLSDCLRKAVSFGIDEGQAILSATLAPARVLGCEKELGSIEPGKLADFVVCGGDLRPLAVYQSGERIA